MGLLERVAARHGRKSSTFYQPPLWTTDALTYPMLSTSPLFGMAEKVEHNFEGYVQAAYKSNGVVFACMLVRQWIFAEARMQWREYRAGRPGELFGSPELALLEQPWPGGTTGELLARMEVTASMAGNYYGTIADDQGRLGRSAQGNRRIVHMRPDWTTIVLDSSSGNPNDLDTRIAGYMYEPPPSGTVRSEPVILLPDEVCHYSPIPDPTARFRGMSWLTPILDEIRADKLATRHKGRFFDNGAQPSMAIKFDKDVAEDKIRLFAERFKDSHQGVDSAYKTLFLGAGADVHPLTVDFQQLDFKVTQGAGETRIAAASGVHPTLVGLSEGLSGSSLNAGNFTAAARLTANKTMRPLWRMAAASLQTLVTPPRPGAALWYDDRDIAFLHEDATDLAEIRAKDAQTLRTLVDGGFNPDSSVEFVATNDLNRLKGSHSGLLPVQLQPPGSGEDRPGASSNGGTNGAEVPALRR